MSSTTTGASTTHAFDPADWLAKFEYFGGAYTVTDSLNLFIYVPGRSDDEISQARRMISDLAIAQEADVTMHLISKRFAALGEG